MTTPRNKRAAAHIRRVTGTSVLVRVAEEATAALAARGIPSLVIGGLALQEHGYARMTTDVDLVVPDPVEAAKWLSISGFKPVREGAVGNVIKMTHRETKAELELLRGGVRVGRPSEPLPLPEPTTVRARPTIISLRGLIENKLSTYLGQPHTRSGDLGDVSRLIQNNHLPRDLEMHEAVRPTYTALWDGIQAEKG